jgi:hypothetical protein
MRLVIGDVFTVPIDDQRSGIGQVVGTYGKDAYFLAIFDVVATASDERLLDGVVKSRVLFLALSMDAKLAAGHWTVVGRQPVPSKMPLPAFKESVGSPGNYEVVNYDGTLRRPATSAEVDLLPNRKVVAPVRLEKALRAKHGIGPWLEAYTDLAPDDLATSRRLFGQDSG